jgi:hypothetical protein
MSPFENYQHVGEWQGTCPDCGQRLEFSIKFRPSTGYYEYVGAKHECAAASGAPWRNFPDYGSAVSLTLLRGMLADYKPIKTLSLAIGETSNRWVAAENTLRCAGFAEQADCLREYYEKAAP